MTGIPKPSNWYRASASVDSAAIVDDSVGASDVANALVYDMEAKTTAVGADSVLINDSEASNINKKATLTVVGELLAGTVGTSSIENTAGVLKVDIANTTAATGPLTTNKVLVDVSGVNKCVTIQNLAKPIGEVFAATNATSALSEVDGVGRVNIGAVTAKTAPIGADMLLIEDTVAPDANVNKMCTITQLAETLAGTVTVSGIENTAGVLAVVPASLTAGTPVGADCLIFGDVNGTPANCATKVTLTNLMEVVAGTVTATGIENNTGVLSVVPCSLTAKTTPVVADVFCMGDSAAPTLAKKTTVTELMEVVAGTVGTTAIENTAGVLSVAPADDALVVGTDSLVYSNAAGVTKKDLVSDVATAMVGVSATTGLTAAAGVMSVAARLVNLVAGQASSLFYVAQEVDYSTSANLVAVKAFDHAGATALPAKGTLVAAFISNTVANSGGTATVISIAKDATPTVKMCADTTNTVADTVFSNRIGNCFFPMPVSGAAAICDPATEDIYVVAAADASRAHTGKVFVFLVFMKTA